MKEARAKRPFPRFERISEDLADGPPGEIPPNRTYGELWRRASLRSGPTRPPGGRMTRARRAYRSS